MPCQIPLTYSCLKGQALRKETMIQTASIAFLTVFYYAAFSTFRYSSWIAFTKRLVISLGLVIAVPITAASTGSLKTLRS